MKSDKSHFVGRSDELAQMAPFLVKETASLLVIKGRRRVGKSRLAEEFSKGHVFHKFSGLPPVEGVTAQDQRDEFARQMSEQMGVPSLKSNDWAELFSFLGKFVQHERVVVLFDEISWMAHGDNTFLSKLKNAWEESFKQNPKLILILCGSISTWIEKNIISSTGYFGRLSWVLHLDPLPLCDSHALLKAQGFKTTAHEIFKLLSVTGGVPWYIEQMYPKATADENIQRQCFTAGGVLANDFDLIFHELFVKRDAVYKRIVTALSGSPLSYQAIAKAIDYPNSGRLTEYLEDLVKAGFVTKDHTWSLRTGKVLALYRYRLSDNYLRFYLKYILPRRVHIEQKRMVSLSAMPGWDGIMGLQFENLVVNNRRELYKALSIKPEHVVYDNPYFQRPTQKQAGVQVDFLIQTTHNTLYVIEIKFSKNPIGVGIVPEMKEKISKINHAKNMVCLPVLIHVNGVSKQLESAGYFYDVVSFEQFL